MATTAEIEAILKLKDEMSAGLKSATSNVQGLTKAKGELDTKAGQLRSGLGNLATQVTGLSPAMLGAAGAVTALGLGIFKSVKDTIALGDELVALNAKTGISIEGLQALKFAAEQNDVAFETLTRAVQMLGSRVAQDTPEAVKAIQALGLSVEQIVNAKPEDAFLRVAERIKEIPNPAQQAALAMDLFGRSGLEVLPAINQNLEGSIEKFKDLGVAMSAETAQAAADLNDRMTELNARWTEIKTTIGGLVIPVLSGLIDIFHLIVGTAKLAAAGYFEFVASIEEGTAKAVDAMALLVPELTGTADWLRNDAQAAREFAKEMETAANKSFREVTERMVLGSQKAKEFSGTLQEASPVVANLTDKVRENSSAVQTWSTTIPVAQSQWDLMLETVPMVTREWDGLSATIPQVADAQAEQNVVAQESVDITMVLADAFSELRGIMTVLGVDSDSVFGKIVGWGSKIFDVFNSVTGLIGKIAGIFGGGGGGGGGIGGAIGGLFGGGGGGLGSLLGLGGGAAGAAGAAAGAGGGAAAAGGAAAGGGGGLLGSIGGLLTNPITGLVAGIGAAAFFGIKAMLKKGDAESTADFLGINFDAVSSDLQDRLQTMGEQVGDFATAIQMNLSSVFAEGGISGGGTGLAEKMADTFSFLDRGQIDAAGAQEILNSTVEQLLPTIDQMGTEGVLQLERLLAAAERTGVEFQGLDELAQAYVARATELGVAVNNVALEGLGATGALDLLNQTNAAAAGAPVVDPAVAAAPFKEAAPDIGKAAGDAVGEKINSEMKALRAEVSSLKNEIAAAVARAIRDNVQFAAASGG